MTARLTDDEIAKAQAIDITNVALGRRLHLKRQGRELVGPCPLCGGTDRFAINVAKQVFNCRGCGGKGRGAISFVQFLDGCDFRAAGEMLIGTRHALTKSDNLLNMARKPSADDERNRRFALELWPEARAPENTPVEVYLNRRGLRLPSSEVIRYLARCPFGKDANGHTVYTPAMIALVRNIITNEPQAIHRTALDLTGNKIEIDGKERMALGSTPGGAVKLTDDAEVTIALAIGEGIETTLSLRRLPEWQGSPVWSLLSASGVRDFPVLPGIETLLVAVDHDAKGGGQKAATKVNARWRADGREVLLAWPENEGEDINDVIRERAS